MSEETMLLVQIRVAGDNSYLATLGQPDGTEKDYEFTVRQGNIEAIEASRKFSDDVDSFGYSNLIYKAISAFHEAHKHAVGRPDWARGKGASNA